MSCHPAPAGDGGSATHQFSSLQVEEGDDPAITAKVVRKVDRHLIPWLFFLAVVCYLDRTNLSFAAVQLSRDLGLSCSAYGLGAGLFFIGYFCFQVPSNMILARVGAPIWLSATVIAWGFVAGSFAFLNGTTMFLILRVALGMAECGTFPGIWLHLSKFYTPRELGRAYATVATSTALAQVIGAPLAAGILSMDGALGLRGWQWLFLTEGTSTIVFGILLRAFLVLSPEKAGFLTQEERTWLQRRQEQQLTSRGDTSFAAQKKALLRVLRDWRVWWMCGCWAGVTQAMYACVYFIPLIVHTIFTATDTVALAPAPMEEAPASGGGCSGEGGGSRIGVAAALLSMVPFAAAAVAMVVNAKLAEAANERHRHAGVPICLAAVMLVLMPLSLRFVGAPVAFICLAMAAACIWSLHGPFMSWPATFLEGPQASIGFAWINSVGSLGGFVGPYVLGVLLDRTGSYSVAMVVLASILLAAGICILFFPVERTLNVQMDEAVPGEAANGGPETDDHWLHKAPASLEREPMLHGAIRSSDL